MHRLLSAIFLSLLLSPLACERRMIRNEASATEPPAFSLAESSRADLALPPAAARVWVGSDGIRVDDQALWQELSVAEQAQLAGGAAAIDDMPLRLEAYKPPGPDPGKAEAGKQDGLVIPALVESLGRIRNRAQQIALLRGREFAAEAHLLIEAEAPYELVERVLFSLGVARFSRLHFAVRSPAGPRTFASVLPGIGGDAMARKDPARPCQSLSVLVSAAGLSWSRRSEDGGGNQSPACEPVLLGAEADSAWQELVTAADLLSEQGHEHIVFFIVRE